MSPRDYQTYVTTSVLALGAGAGVYFLVRGKVKEAQIANVQETGLQAGTASNWAKRLKMAFDNDSPFGWGTDEVAVYQVFKELPNKRAYSEVQRNYKILYGKDLNAQLQDELDSKEFQIVTKIYNSKKP